MERLLAHQWHQAAVDEAARLLGTSRERGLNTFEVKHRQEHFGPNVVTAEKRTGPIVRFLLQFHSPLVYILLAAAATTALLHEWVDASVILGVVLVNAVIGFVQEAKAEEAIESLKKMVHTEATVVRDGKRGRIPSVEIVPGDLVLLQSGDRVPADLRLIRARDFKIDESALTGESLPVAKDPDVLPDDTSLADRANMAYAGTMVASGQGQGLVVATGDKTETGRIAHLISEAVDLETPLTRKIATFSKVMLFVILALAAATFALGLLRAEPALDTFMAAVALAVGAIPEGLPAAVSITLALGVNRMAGRRAIIRKLPAVETLGSTTVICSDKTGTLTENQMTVQRISAGGETYQLTGVGYAPVGEIVRAEGQGGVGGDRALVECLTAGLLCNDSSLVERENRWTVEGDPTEGALISAAIKGRLSQEDVHARLPRIDVMPFESHRQCMATLHDAGEDRPRIAYVKGSVEKVLERCSGALMNNGETGPLDRTLIHEMAERLAGEGLRVLAFGRGVLPSGADKVECEIIETGLEFLGLQAMMDPPRPEAIEAVAACQRAGIRIKMITGDHCMTATAIAAKMGIQDRIETEHPSCSGVTGKDLSGVSDADILDVAENTSVFARVAPDQKLRLVDALQARGHVVAMTGDGVNDAPALKQADIGIAMGRSGTDVAREAADMLLTDDNFASIRAAVEEGRGVFDNLTKFIVWTLPTNLGEGLVILAAILAGSMLPILPVQILWINMTTAVCMGLMLAFEPKEPGIMERPPRNPRAPILTRDIVGRLAIVAGIMLVSAFALFEWLRGTGAELSEARTAAVNVFVIVELFYLFNCRSLSRSMFRLGVFSNRWIVVGVGAMLLLQMLFTYLPAMNRFFESSPIGWVAWGWILGAGIVTYGAVEAEKWLRRRTA